MNLKKILITSFIILVIGALLAVSGLVYFYNSEINRPIKLLSDEKITLNIKKGMGVSEIAGLLEKENLIQYPDILRAYLYLNKDKSIQAGYYHFSSADFEGDLNLIKLVDKLQGGSFETRLTFIEGWRTEEYVDYLREEMGPEFADKFANSEYIKDGYLFPDTYTIENDSDPESLASWMRNTFEKKVMSRDDFDTKLLATGLTQDEVIVLASILEREMHIVKDRPKVAGILLKRLQNGWPLQADATVQYVKANLTKTSAGAKKDWWPVVTRDDLKTLESPYNTYLNKELPPAPICNPGAAAVNAVLDFEETPYWFYITGSDGITRYAETLDEHNLNVQKYIK